MFDNISHDLLLKAVRKYVMCKWALIYIERWLTAPMEQKVLKLIALCVSSFAVLDLPATSTATAE